MEFHRKASERRRRRKTSVHFWDLFLQSSCCGSASPRSAVTENRSLPVWRVSLLKSAFVPLMTVCELMQQKSTFYFKISSTSQIYRESLNHKMIFLLCYSLWVIFTLFFFHQWFSFQPSVHSGHLPVWGHGAESGGPISRLSAGWWNAGSCYGKGEYVSG